MKLVKSLLLGSAAGLAAVAGAQAADLPSKKAAPVEYVRVCSAHGAGFFYIPGSDTCIKLGGQARFEYQYSQPYSRRANVFGMRALGRMEMDARNSTEYGLLRAFVRVDVARRTGSLRSSVAVGAGTAFDGATAGYVAAAQTQVDLQRAFVQLGGLTAGRTVSFFGFYNGDLEFNGVTMGDGLVTNALAYTATFGSGFSATLSVEDPVERRNGLVSVNGTTITGANALATNGGFTYGGAQMPDFVAALRVDQSWGSAQLSGAIHQVRIAGADTAAAPTPGNVPDTKIGWAIQGGVKVNLPMLAAGDAFYLQAAYAQGATSYLLTNPQGTHTGQFAVGKLSLRAPDAVWNVSNGAPGGVSLVSVWGLTAGLLHYWTPTIRQALYGSYIQSDVPSAAFNGAGGAVAANNLRSGDYWVVGSNVVWSPVKNLDIGAELQYVTLDSDGRINGAQPKDTAVGALYNNGSAIVSRIRIMRTF